ncbi:D-3-phosphoglycerate dehydrogenase 2-like isoform X1 [Nymphaea colorata]|nr:D-3-phosphoglycerate dehydrogenase 2-like isoform X1 [Nymphaea colorata]XP_049932666.1 D-3-phosphoglycerate dehydrogenase 2-like isoform X1 [Nymphaea colorata]XP_049932676.1 D-3-phosphoglycerate dehydrogenase 2-like isoform X1 [Nymphaea colorata]XP_049932684.1 D-3-phosphoglycerate dehydrogenase 2-like isoform X1 [Nymphaea colorata]XP_049932685.1 D-3-phosphoglycerate dehydrogenase 2-like isoform X1 [Nymphaea colorata]
MEKLKLSLSSDKIYLEIKDLQVECHILDLIRPCYHSLENAMGDRLVLHENVVVTPHLGASTDDAQEKVSIEVAEAVIGPLEGELFSTIVNAPMVLPDSLSSLSATNTSTTKSHFLHTISSNTDRPQDHIVRRKGHLLMFPLYTS